MVRTNYDTNSALWGKFSYMVGQDEAISNSKILDCLKHNSKTYQSQCSIKVGLHKRGLCFQQVEKMAMAKHVLLTVDGIDSQVIELFFKNFERHESYLSMKRKRFPKELGVPWMPPN